MQNPFLYPGRGQALYGVTSSTTNTKTEPWVTLIVNNGFTETIAAHDCLELMFEFVFALAATGDVLVEKVATAEATVAGTTYATVTAAAELSKNWNAGKPLQGFFRIKNTSGQSVTVYCQKRIH